MSSSKFTYAPIITLKPAEMIALSELPELDKDLMCPIFRLGPWGVSKHLAASVTKIKEVYGNRPCFVWLVDPHESIGQRPVHDEISSLHSEAWGYDNWQAFINEHRNFIPAIQYRSRENIRQQVEKLSALGRGVLVAFNKSTFSTIDVVTQHVAESSADQSNIFVLIDLEQVKADINYFAGVAIDNINTIIRNMPAAKIILSGSSFPPSFEGIAQQQIYERSIYDAVQRKLQKPIIYSDRAGARAEKLSGGAGVTYARIDYAREYDWSFFRSRDPDAPKEDEYVEQARATIASDIWDSKLRIWGTQMIERTALGDKNAIISVTRATAVRINMHIHSQIFRGDETGFYDTDDEWND